MRAKKCRWTQSCGVGDTDTGDEVKRGKRLAKTTLWRKLGAEKRSERIVLHIFLFFKMGGTRAHFILLMGENLRKREKLIIHGRKCY